MIVLVVGVNDKEEYYVISRHDVSTSPQVCQTIKDGANLTTEAVYIGLPTHWSSSSWNALRTCVEFCLFLGLGRSTIFHIHIAYKAVCGQSAVLTGLPN